MRSPVSFGLILTLTIHGLNADGHKKTSRNDEDSADKEDEKAKEDQLSGEEGEHKSRARRYAVAGLPKYYLPPLPAALGYGPPSAGPAYAPPAYAPPAYAPPEYAPPAYAPTYRGLKSYGPAFGGGTIFPGIWQNNFFNPHAALPIFQMGKHTKFQSQYQDAYGNQDQGQKFGHDQIQNQNQNALGTQQIGQSVDGRLQVAGQEAGGRQNMNQADNIMDKFKKHPPPAHYPPQPAAYKMLSSDLISQVVEIIEEMAPIVKRAIPIGQAVLDAMGDDVEVVE